MLEPCQMPGSCVDDASTRRAEWERQSRFAGVFEPWPGCSRAAPSLRYNNRLNIDGLLRMRGRKNGAYITILLSPKTRRLLSASRLRTFSSTYTVPVSYGIERLGHEHRARFGGDIGLVDDFVQQVDVQL